jgi:Protein of unknown function (DUF3224)
LPSPAFSLLQIAFEIVMCYTHDYAFSGRKQFQTDVKGSTREIHLDFLLVIATSAFARSHAKNDSSNQIIPVKQETTSMRKHATTTFTLDSWDEKSYDEKEGAPRLSRVSSTKSYKGDIEGQSKLEYLMMYRPDGTATFIGLERVTGSVGGRSGSFVLQHTGTFEGGAAKTILSILPNSGTGDLRNISGEGAFNVQHDPPYTMTLDYNFD